MSYILDALKKVEHEKARKASSGGMTGISGDLFKELIPRTSRGGSGKIIIAIVLVALVTFAITWFMLKGDKKRDAVAPRSSVPSVVNTPVVLTPPVVPAPVPQIIPQPVVPVSNDVKSAAKTEEKLVIAPTVVPQSQKNLVQTIPAPADIKVSGIAWQEERAARRAVINGFLLQEGVTVSGSKILEIYQDRVRFISPAGTFDVRMDAAALPGTVK